MLIKFLDTCPTEVTTLVGIVKFVLSVIQWAIPIVLIILGTIDMFKAMTKGDDKEQAKVRQTFIRRLIYALVAFLIPFIVRLAFSLASRLMENDTDIQNNLNGVTGSKGFVECWNYDSKSTSKSSKTPTNRTKVWCQYDDGTLNGYKYYHECLAEGGKVIGGNNN